MYARWADSNLSKPEIYMCKKGRKVSVGQGRAAAGKEPNAFGNTNAFSNTKCISDSFCNPNTNTNFFCNANAYAKCASDQGRCIF
jgi:hypothetical protein